MVAKKKTIKKYNGSDGDTLVHCKKDSRKHFAWCECGDTLDTKEIKNDKGMITEHEYYCRGCNVTYKLEKKKNERNNN